MDPEQLGPLDAAFLSLDGETTVGNVCTTALLTGRISMDQLRGRLAARIDEVPALRRRLQPVLGGLGRPWWVDDTEFQLENHLFETALSTGATDSELAAVVSSIAMRPLDRSHPLWQVYLIHDTAGGRSAVATKVHHALGDGMWTLDFLETLLREDSGRRAAPTPWDPTPSPGPTALALQGMDGVDAWAGAIGRFGRRAVGMAAQIAGSVAETTLGGPVRLLGTGHEEEPHPSADDGFDAVSEDPPEEKRSIRGLDAVRPLPRLRVAPATPFNQRISRDRGYAFGSIDLSRSRRLRRETGTTVTDLVLAATAGGLRAWLHENDWPTPEPLVALVPMSTRSIPRPAEHSAANRLAVALCSLPTHIADPAGRLHAAGAEMRRAKRAPTMDEGVLEDLTRLALPIGLDALHTVTAHLHVADRLRLPFNLVVSTMPPPKRTLGIHGHTVTHLFPCPPLTDGLGLNVTVHGYRGHLDLGVTACGDLIPNVSRLFELVMSAHDELVALAPGGDPPDQASTGT